MYQIQRQGAIRLNDLIVSTVFLVLCVSIIGWDSVVFGEQPDDAAKGEIQKLKYSLSDHQIGLVEIRCIPDEIEMPIRINQKMIDKNFFYLISIRDLRYTPLEVELQHVFYHIDPKIDGLDTDIRWGMLFFDSNRNLITRLYLSSSGLKGAVGAYSVSFKVDTIARWLSQHFPACVSVSR